MPRDKDRKRIIRSRMRKTGESYTAARAHVISKSRENRPPEPAVDYGARAGISDERIAEKTGRPWKEWVRVLDRDGAATMPHREIAALAHGKHGVGDWWAQAVTVGYERLKGLRDRGQRRGGSYEASKSKTFKVGVNALFHAWADEATRRKWLDGVNAKVRTATAPKGMRLQWPDGAIVAVWFAPKAQGKSAVALAHTKLRDKQAVAEAKKFWTDRLDALASLLERTR